MVAPTARDSLALVSRLSQVLSLTSELDEVLERVMDEVIGATRAERGVLLLRTPEGAPTYHAARGLAPSVMTGPKFRAAREILERVLQEGHPFLGGGARSDGPDGARAGAAQRSSRAVLCVPLHAKGQARGAIYVDRRLKSGSFDALDAELLKLLAHQAAVAIHNAELFRTVNQRLASLHLIQDISRDLTSTLDLNRVLAACLERVQGVLNTEAGSIIMVEGDALVFKVAIGERSDRVKPFRIPKGHGLAGWVAQNAQGIFINDVRSDPRFYSNVDATSGFVTRQLMAAPLMINERVTGVIEVFNKPGGFTQSDLDLLLTIGSSAAIAIENARLYALAVERGRLERELQVAHEVQASLIPRETPQVPGWEFSAHWQAALEMSGDYYDFLVDSPAHIGMVLADVADKGMPAALFMALTRSTLRASAADGGSSADTLARANRLVSADAAKGMFVTLLYAVLDPASGCLRFANAGHPPPIHFRAAVGDIVELTSHGIALGVIEEVEYPEETVRMDPGDLMLFYTDGVTDALNARGEEFGHPRLLEIVRQRSRVSSAQLHADLRDALRQFVGSTPLADDMTFVVIRRQ